MLQTHALVVRELDRQLSLHHALPVREFDTLITLFNGPGQRLRMSELASRVMLSPSGLTRLVERLERGGLVRRETDASDARSFYAVLTPAGLQRLDEARVTHNAVIRELFARHFNDEELARLGTLWRKVIGNGDSTPSPAAE
jgi:DNA-binding MarR family transcriptional regulator